MSDTHVYLRLLAIAIAMYAGSYGSYRMATHTIAGNRAAEQELEKLEWPLKVKRLVHFVRDDVGAIQNLIVIANSLLAGILAALIAQFAL